MISRAPVTLTLLVALAVTATSLSNAADDKRDAEIFGEANAAYEAGDFSAAELGYRALVLDRGLHDEEVYYNWGCSLARLGRYGEAAWTFRRALHLAPRMGDAAANLEWVRARLVDSQTAESSSRDAARRVLDAVPRGASLVGGLALWWLGAAVLLWAWLKRRELWIAGASLAAVGALLCIAPLTDIALASSESRAVVVSERVEARSGPTATSPVLFTAHAGFEVDVQRARAGWARVTTAAGLSGWMPTEDLRPFSPTYQASDWGLASGR